VSLDREYNSLTNDAETLTHFAMDKIIKEAFSAACTDPDP
jgi:hypothetical protein